MTIKTFPSLVVSATEDNTYLREIKERNLQDLPAGDVLVRVKYSSLNYKDVLSATGNKGVTKNYPHTPGIDAAGVLEESQSPDFKPGDEVIVTGYDLGMNTPGGFGQFIRVPAAWLVKRPDGLSLRESMIYGTAGFTAALSVYRLLDYGMKPERGKILVSGATGGVGSVAVSILAKEGFQVTAASGRPETRDYLAEIGAREIISAEEATDQSSRALLKEQWAGAVDTVGGPLLATTIKSVKYGGGVTCCGNVASPDLSLTVYPFILRGITLMGIDSQNCPMPTRVKVWQNLAGPWKLPHLERLVTETTLEGLNQQIELMLARRHQGRTIVRLPE